MKPSGCAKFPFKIDFENNCLGRAHSIEETVLSAIRLFLVTKPGSRLGNPIGSFLPELLLTLIPRKSLGQFSTDLRKELNDQFPGVTFLKVILDLDLSNQIVDLVVSISFSVSEENLTELEIRLPSIFTSDYYIKNENI